MSRVLPPLGLRERLFGPRPPARPNDAFADRVERAVRRLEPDPLYRRRLRSVVVNQYVAQREGHTRNTRVRRREMGTLGRSVLYASLVLAMGVSAVGAAAQDTVPGDALYPTKLQLEQVRMRVAPPELRADLAGLALAERIAELEQLAAAGDWSRLPAAAAQVVAAEQLLAALGPATIAPPSDGQAVEVLESVLVDAPATARPGLENAIQAIANNQSAAPPAGQPATGSSTGRGGGDAVVAPRIAVPDAPGRPDHAATPETGSEPGNSGHKPDKESPKPSG